MTMNVYQKLQSARVELQSHPMKPSGNNKFAGYTYMELGDFMPLANTIMDKHGLCGLINFADTATLTIVNTENPEDRVQFSSPMSSANLKGCHEVQNLGAVHTYLRRYLWVLALEICEHDALDSTKGKDDASSPLSNVKPTNTPPPSSGKADNADPGISKLLELVKPHGLTVTDLENLCASENKGLTLHEITLDHLRELYKQIAASLKADASGFVSDVTALRAA